MLTWLICSSGNIQLDACPEVMHVFAVENGGLVALTSVFRRHMFPIAVFTLVTRGRFLTSASKFSIEANGEIFDVSPENDHTSPNVKTHYTGSWTFLH